MSFHFYKNIYAFYFECEASGCKESQLLLSKYGIETIFQHQYIYVYIGMALMDAHYKFINKIGNGKMARSLKMNWMSIYLQLLATSWQRITSWQKARTIFPFSSYLFIYLLPDSNNKAILRFVYMYLYFLLSKIRLHFPFSHRTQINTIWGGQRWWRKGSVWVHLERPSNFP